MGGGRTLPSMLGKELSLVVMNIIFLSVRQGEVF
jgi:hypothetical protein